jgi:hypothetical protein
LEYSLTIAELAALLGDSHATVTSSVLTDYIGTHVPPLELKSAEDKTVVSFVYNDQQTNGLPLGIEVLAIDGGEKYLLACY